MNLTESLFLILIACCLIYFLIHSMLKITESRGYNYAIKLNNVDKSISFQTNPNIMKYIKIISHPDDSTIYTVISQKNEVFLKDLIMAEYELSTGQVAITPLQNSDNLGSL